MTTSDITKSARERLEKAEEIFKACYLEDRQPTFEERLWLTTDGGMDDKTIRSEQRRVNRVARAMETAGTKQQRTAMAKAADDAEQELKTKGKELAAEIERLQAEHKAMERDAHLKRKRSDEAVAAVVTLRENAPKFVQDEYNSHLQALNKTLRRDLLDLESEIKGIEADLNLDPTNPHDVETIKGRGRQYVEDASRGQDNRTGGNTMARYRVTPAWTEHIEAERARLPEMVKERDRLQAEYDTELAELNQIRDYYVQ